MTNSSYFCYSSVCYQSLGCLLKACLHGASLTVAGFPTGQQLLDTVGLAIVVHRVPAIGYDSRPAQLALLCR
jgi:hypothetical protein